MNLVIRFLMLINLFLYITNKSFIARPNISTFFKLKSSVLFILLSLSPWVYAVDVSLDQTSCDNVKEGSSLSFNHFVTAGLSDSMAVVTLGVNGISNPSSITAMTYGGVSMTLEGFESFDGRIVAVYTLANPPAGNNNVFIDVSGTRDITMCTAGYANVDQTDAFDNLQGGSGQSSNISNTLDCDEGSAIIDHFVVDDENANPASGQTVVHFETNDNGAERLYSSIKIAGPGPDTLQWTIGNAAEYTYLYGCLRATPALPDAKDDNIDGSSLTTPGDMLNIDPLIDNGNGADSFGDDGAGTIPVQLIDPVTNNPSNSITTSLGGTVVVNDGGTPNDPTDDTFDYTSPYTANVTLNESFQYQICDSSNPADCDIATVTFSVTTPVTLSSTASEMVGDKVKVDWTTSSELFNVGYQLWGLDGHDKKWGKLHNWLVKSGSGNAVEPQSYRKTVIIPKSISELIALGISSVDSDGSEYYYGPFELGQSYGDLSQLEPIAWNHIRSQMDKSMASRGYVKDRVNGYRKVSAVTQANALSAETVIEFSVATDGMYRLTAQELLSAGIDWRDVRRGDIALIDHRGEPLVRYVWARGDGRGLNKTLGDKGEVYFYGQSLSESDRLYSDRRMYRLVLNRYQALEAQVQGKQGIQGEYSEYYMERAVVENDQLYVLTSAADDPWVSQVVTGYPDKPRMYGVQIPVEEDALWDHGSILRLGLGRSSHLAAVDLDADGHQDSEHLVEGLVLSSAGSNGLLTLATETAVGVGEWTVEFPIPANTPLTLNDGHVIAGGSFSAGSGYAFSEIHVDNIGFEYARPYVAKGNDRYLHFSAPDDGAQAYEVVVPDVGWPWVFGSDGSNLVRIGLESQAKQTNGAGEKQRVVRFGALANLNDTEVRYWVSGKASYLGVADLIEKTVQSKDALRAQAAGSTMLIIAHPVFMGDVLSSYADFKRNQGFSVSIIDYLDIMASYGGGQPGPHGLTNYLSNVSTQGDLEHVLVVGGSTYDHTDKQGTGAVTFIPGHYGKSNYSKYTVSDVPYITDGNNNLFSSIGRWPVRTLDDLHAIVDKSTHWATSDHTNGASLLVSEHTVAGENINFGDALDGVAALLPNGWSQSRVYVDQILAENPGYSITQALSAARTGMINELNNMPDLVLYNGHATTSQLSNKALFKSTHAGTITTSGAEMWLPLSCYVTFYESTHVNTLAHQLLFSGNAVTITGAMLLSNQSGNIAAGKAILESTFNNGKRIGEAVNAHKAQAGSDSLKVNWALLGDPTLRF